jgi:hypothetical protein
MPSNYASVTGSVEYNGLIYGFEAGVNKIPEVYGMDIEGNRGEVRYSYELDEVTLITDENDQEVIASAELYELVDQAISKGDFTEV